MRAAFWHSSLVLIIMNYPFFLIPLMYILQLSFLNAAQMIPKNGRPSGEDLLLAYTEMNQPAAVELLLDLGISIETRTAQGNTALHRACYNGSLSLVDLLLRRGARVNARNNEGMTPLHCHMAMGGQNETILAMLLYCGGAIMAGDLEGRTPLHYAAMGGSSSTARKLLLSYSLQKLFRSTERARKRLFCFLCVLKRYRVSPVLSNYIISKSSSLRQLASEVIGMRLLLCGDSLIPSLARSSLISLCRSAHLAHRLSNAVNHDIELVLKKSSFGRARAIDYLDNKNSPYYSLQHVRKALAQSFYLLLEGIDPSVLDDSPGLIAYYWELQQQESRILLQVAASGNPFLSPSKKGHL